MTQSFCTYIACILRIGGEDIVAQVVIGFFCVSYFFAIGTKIVQGSGKQFAVIGRTIEDEPSANSIVQLIAEGLAGLGISNLSDFLLRYIRVISKVSNHRLKNGHEVSRNNLFNSMHTSRRLFGLEPSGGIDP